MQKEYIHFDGHNFVRYPNSPKRAHRVYFCTTIKKHKIMLHRYIYAKEHGEIPKGFVIHHKNENPLDNSLDNLCLMSKAEHQALHGKLLWEKANAFKKRKMQEKMFANQNWNWHRSEIGRKTMSIRAKKQMSQKRLIVCAECGKEAKVVKNCRARFCSQKCKRRLYRREWNEKHPRYFKDYNRQWHIKNRQKKRV